MTYGSILTLASIEAARPVFLVVMGVFLTIIAWRLAKTSGTWTARILTAGALMLGLGYAVIIPLYHAGIIEPFSPRGHYHGSAAAATAWHTVKLVTMNTGWLFFGLGIAMHAKILNAPAPRPRAETHSLPPHESVA